MGLKDAADIVCSDSEEMSSGCMGALTSWLHYSAMALLVLLHNAKFSL